MNILHYGLILYQPYEITRGLREIGCSSDYALWDDYKQDWLMHGWDVNLKMDEIEQPLKKWKQRIRLGTFVQSVLVDYDIIHFHSHPTFTHSNFMLATSRHAKLLKLFKKKQFVTFWGCDARRWKTDIKYSWSPCRQCSFMQRQYCSISSKKAIETARKYCDVVFSTGDLCVGTEYTWTNVAINTNEFFPGVVNHIPDKYKIERSSEDEFVIYHSFGNSSTRPDVKGSGYIKTAVEGLQRKGYKIRYLFVDRVPNEDIKYIQCQADLVIDQLCAGSYGTTAVECMALGKPVVAYLRQDVLDRCPNENIPIINANPHTIKQTLVDLIERRDVLPGVGKKSREYVEKYHDRKVVARELLEYYRRDYS